MQQTQFFPFVGGENFSQPAITLKPGELLSSLNYEAVTTGGYRRVDGYERFDGQTAPSEQGFKVVPFDTGTIAFNAGDTVTGLTSGATGTVMDSTVTSGSFGTSDAVGYVSLKDIAGAFVSGEDLQVSAVTNAISTGADATTTGDDTIDTAFRISGMEYARSLIGALPGSGPVRGVFYYKGVVYAFRDNAGGTACVMFKSTSSGWQVVTTPVLNPGGKYEFVEYNFFGSSGTKMIYGTSGVNKAFQFDGTTYTEITTGMTTDTPQHVAAFKKYLFLSFAGGSLQNSPLGDPTGTWTPVTGAAEIATGDEIVGLLTLQGDTLAVFNRNRLYLLQGTSISNFNLVEFSDESGAVEWSIQRIGGGMFVDDRGITTLTAVQSFGDFNAATLSQKINKRLSSVTNQVVTSVRVKSRDQYIVFFDTGDATCATYSGETLVGFTSLRFPNKPQVMYNGESSNGDERIFFGDDEGYVYEMNKGTSFDGQSVEASLRLAFNHVGSPAYNKRFFKVTLEVEAGNSLNVKFNADYSYGDLNVPLPIEQDFSVRGGGGYWDIATWDTVLWDGQPISNAEAYLDGVGKNLSFLIYSNETYEAPHTLQGAIIYFSGRGLVR